MMRRRLPSPQNPECRTALAALVGALACVLMLFMPGCAHPRKPGFSPTASAFRGIYTAIYRVPDLAAAKAWYGRAFDVEPYFDQPFYVGFDIGGYELGLQPEAGEKRAGAGGGVAYWGVGNADGAVARLLALGASLGEEVRDVGGGVRVATVIDPWGNVLGVIENPHFRHAERVP